MSEIWKRRKGSKSVGEDKNLWLFGLSWWWLFRWLKILLRGDLLKHQYEVFASFEIKCQLWTNGWLLGKRWKAKSWLEKKRKKLVQPENNFTKFCLRSLNHRLRIFLFRRKIMFRSQNIQVFVILTIPWFTKSVTSRWVLVHEIRCIFEYMFWTTNHEDTKLGQLIDISKYNNFQ